MPKKPEEGTQRPGNNPAQVLDVLRDVLLEHTRTADFHPEYQVQSAVYIGYSGALLTNDDIA
jgi:hypothetical protein